VHDRSFLLIWHFRNSRLLELSHSCHVRDIAETSIRHSEELKVATVTITVHEQAKMISHPRNDVDVPPAPHSLAPNEPKAPIAILTPAKRAALIACLNCGGTLYRRRGVWVPTIGPSDQRISGITVADLGRDGMLTLSILGRHASAHLTSRGSWFARTAAAMAG
jgi:hypothetical protein